MLALFLYIFHFFKIFQVFWIFLDTQSYVFKVAIYEETKKSQNNHQKEEPTSFWGPIDMSLCFSIYLVSAVILIFVYFKFIAKKNICFGFIYNTMFKHQHQKKSLHDVVWQNFLISKNILVFEILQRL